MESILTLPWLLMQNLFSSATRSSRAKLIRLLTVLLLASGMALPLAGQCVAESGVWLKIDTQEATLTVMKGSEPQKVFKDIAIGRYGTCLLYTSPSPRD